MVHPLLDQPDVPITYLDRVNISTVAPVISKEFGFDKVTMGIIFSAFVWAYALFQVPGGWLNDRFGPRRVVAIKCGRLRQQGMSDESARY